MYVSVCVAGSFGEDCSVTCEDCANGGVCGEKRDSCMCKPGWMGITCNQSESHIISVTELRPVYASM